MHMMSVKSVKKRVNVRMVFQSPGGPMKFRDSWTISNLWPVLYLFRYNMNALDDFIFV